MVKFKKNKSKYKFWYSPFFLFIFLIILAFFGYKIFCLIGTHRETIQMRKIAEDELNELSVRIDDLNREISELNTEEGKEGVIRVKYQVAKEGEKVLSIVEDGQEENGENIVLDEKDQNRKSFFVWFKGLFKK
jgi:cell division protein FtsB